MVRERLEHLPEEASVQFSETILVVDDEDIVRRIVARELLKHGYHVLEAWDGESALRVCALTKRIHLLLTDVSMKGISGPQLAQILTSSRPEMKVLFMSGYPENIFTPPPGLGMAFIEKTFTMDELNKMIRELLDPGSSERDVGGDQIWSI
jgi:DNA-binding NtrC family response regulator